MLFFDIRFDASVKNSVGGGSKISIVLLLFILSIYVESSFKAISVVVFN